MLVSMFNNKVMGKRGYIFQGYNLKKGRHYDHLFFFFLGGGGSYESLGPLWHRHFENEMSIVILPQFFEVRRGDHESEKRIV